MQINAQGPACTAPPGLHSEVRSRVSQGNLDTGVLVHKSLTTPDLTTGGGGRSHDPGPSPCSGGLAAPGVYHPRPYY